MLSYNQFFLKCEIENLAVVLTAKWNIIIVDWEHLIKLAVTSLYEIWVGKDTNPGFGCAMRDFLQCSSEIKPIFTKENIHQSEKELGQITNWPLGMNEFVI